MILSLLMPLLRSNKSLPLPPGTNADPARHARRCASSGISPRFVVNVTSPEGQFATTARKTSDHVHTNMAKAALNMMTRTLAPSLKAEGIYMTSVGTGWVSRMRPGEQSTASETAPLTDRDGAARVLMPVLHGYLSGNDSGEHLPRATANWSGRMQQQTERLSGVLLQNFEVAEW